MKAPGIGSKVPSAPGQSIFKPGAIQTVSHFRFGELQKLDVGNCFGGPKIMCALDSPNRIVRQKKVRHDPAVFSSVCAQPDDAAYNDVCGGRDFALGDYFL